MAVRQSNATFILFIISVKTTQTGTQTQMCKKQYSLLHSKPKNHNVVHKQLALRRLRNEQNCKHRNP